MFFLIVYRIERIKSCEITVIAKSIKMAKKAKAAKVEKKRKIRIKQFYRPYGNKKLVILFCF